MINKILNYIVDRFRKDELVNTITFNDLSVVDVAKNNLYPIVAINFQNRRESDNLFLYDFRIYVLQQRNIEKFIETSKLMEDTNFIDNLAECESIITNFLNYITRLDITSNVNVAEQPQLNMVANYGSNGLDGFNFNLTLSYPNHGYCQP